MRIQSLLILHRKKKLQDQKQASSQKWKRFVLPGAYEEYAMQVAAFVECHATICTVLVGKHFSLHILIILCMFLSGMEKYMINYLSV